MKKEIIDACLAKKMLCKDGAKMLNMHPKAFLRLKSRYAESGEAILVPRPPGPKNGFVAGNRTSEKIESLVCSLAWQYTSAGPIELADLLYENWEIRLHQSTVYRILRRKHIRYNREYVKILKQKPQLYCLETPGEEVQLDACYPFGRGRQLCCFDAIDDCCRFVVGKMYDRENGSNAIDFIKYLIQKAPFPIKRIRIDNRSKHVITNFCKSIGIEVIVNNAHTPKQNGKIERYHKTVKNSFFWKYCGFYDNIDLIDYRLQQFLAYYNEKRPHGGYGMNRLTPVQKMAGSLFNSLYILPVEKVTLTMQSYIC